MAMDEGQVVSWRVAPGDAVRVGQVILEIESEKTTAEIETPVDGFVGPLLVDVGTTVPVDALLVRIGRTAEEAVDPPPDALDQVSSSQPPASLTQDDLNGRRGVRSSASPRARKLALDRGVDLSPIRGSGPAGAIVEADIERAAEAQSARSNDVIDNQYVSRALSPIRRRVAERTAESARTAPHFSLSRDIDGTALAATLTLLRRDEDASKAAKTTLNDLLMLVTARTLVDHPQLNSAYFDEGVREWTRVHLGMMVAIEGSLVAPVLRNAGQMSLELLKRTRRDLVERAQQGRLTPDQMSGGTFSVSNLGAFGVERFTSILNRGQAAILSVGALTERPAAIDGNVSVRPLMTLTLTVDHRCVDGVAGARFLGDLHDRLKALNLGEVYAY
jgi:pyruvate dehydrogenase E2 component (dihydrolipoamide acetyltransferase)